ncbi:hypothetical protein RJ640_008448 [Escallonia rubra]|uniref:Aminopeptidase n=1 Tax=Escallonia rubra TaxID=112253 RepID=A0AA88QCP4_9ASTE|nr:hypothetical protein RJ640_008448 [Escallonia rubra]
MEHQDPKKIEQFKGQPRLPTFAVPKRYDLTIKTDLSACNFSGTVLIRLSILQATRFLVLNALELVINEVSFTDSHNHRHIPCDVVVDSDDEILVLVFEQALGVGDGVLGIGFSGPLSEHMKGFYKGFDIDVPCLFLLTYVEAGVKKNMAATQFEAVDARRCFPCWDEPALKDITRSSAINKVVRLPAKANAAVDGYACHFHIFVNVLAILSSLLGTPVSYKPLKLVKHARRTRRQATFKITLDDVPSELTALSNMPVSLEKVDGQLKTVYFEDSPIMSTYLVAFVIGSFDHIEDTTTDGIKVRAFCPVGKSEQGKFALDVAVRALDLYRNYFSMPYPLPKLDMVAVPEFPGGAMENYGLITYCETELLHDDLHSAAANTQRLAIVVTHEVAHQWFGNLVTMEWWTHLWLNEGFATWVSYLATDKLFPEWKIWTQFLEMITGGLVMDSLEQSHPIEVDIPHARSIEELFDAIGYKKGSSVIRMLQDYVGDDVFQRSLASYINRFACQNVKTEDLWSVLSEESGVEVNSMMDLWTKQKGYPVISVEYKDQILEFEQSQFLSSGLNGDGQWIVPITVSLGSYDKRNNFLLETKHGRLDISELSGSCDGSSNSNEKRNQEELDKNLWVKINVGQTGFYRVKYDDKLTARLRKAIVDKCLSPSDKFGVYKVIYAFVSSDVVGVRGLVCCRELINETLILGLRDHGPSNVCYNVTKVSIDAMPDSVDDLKQFFINLILLSSEKLGWEPTSGESHLSALLREQVLMALATFGHSRTHEEAMKRFQTYLVDRNTSCLPVDIRKATYISVMSHTSTTNRNGFESLLMEYREADAVQEKTRILRSMASCPDPIIVLEVLNLMMSEEVRDQDVIYGLAGISLEGRETAWIWLNENWDAILKRWGTGMILHYFIRDIVTPFCSHEKADEVEAFFASRMHPSFAMNLRQSIEKVRIKARWVDNIKQEESLKDLVKGLACMVVAEAVEAAMVPSPPFNSGFESAGKRTEVHKKADEVEAFFASRSHPSFAMNLRQSIDRIRLKARWVDNIKQEESLKDLVKATLRSSGSLKISKYLLLGFNCHELPTDFIVRGSLQQASLESA